MLLGTRFGLTSALTASAFFCASFVHEDPKPAPTQPPTICVFPCDAYEKGLTSGGNFGLYVDAEKSPFHDSYHLGEDVWLPAATPVRAIADGIVRYSSFSPTWTDASGRVHWNLGNVIVIEHAIAPAVGEANAMCSIYVHLASNRRVAVGDRVTLGQEIGRIGADKSEENGRYPAHLHFGIHRGPYVQIAPGFKRGLETEAASKDGLRAGDIVLRGALEIRRLGESSVLVKSKDSGASIVLSLLVGSTAPKDPPPDIMSWCQGYGDKATVDEWFKPSTFVRERLGAKPVEKR